MSANVLALALWATAILAIACITALAERTLPDCIDRALDYLLPLDLTPTPETEDWRERTWAQGQDYGYEEARDA